MPEAPQKAALLAEDAAAAGADAVMVFPPFSWALGADDRLIQAHHRVVAAASGLPLLLFQESVGAGKTRYGSERLGGFLEIDAVTGIREGSREVAAHEATRRPDEGAQAGSRRHGVRRRDLFACFLLRSEGSLVSLAAVVPELIVALERAVAEREIDTARDLHNRLYHLARLVYAPPGHLATPRLKTCLTHLGRQSGVATRLAAWPLSEAESDSLRQALVHAGVAD